MHDTIIIFILPQVPKPLLCVVVDVVEEHSHEEVAGGVEGHVVEARCVEQQCLCHNHTMMLIKEIRRCSSNQHVQLEFTLVGNYETP